MADGRVDEKPLTTPLVLNLLDCCYCLLARHCSTLYAAAAAAAAAMVSPTMSSSLFVCTYALPPWRQRLAMLKVPFPIRIGTNPKFQNLSKIDKSIEYVYNHK